MYNKYRIMRVIAGKYKGRALIAPKTDVRPTLDRMKETLFNIINFRLGDAVVLDLFAGSGQLAIESLSRGASRAILCDNNRQSVNVIKQNFSKIGVNPEIVFGDYSFCLKTVRCKFDVVFVDPPYKSEYYQDVLSLIDDKELLTQDGIVVCEHLAEDILPNVIGCLILYDSRTIGTVKFDFYRRSEKCA